MRRTIAESCNPTCSEAIKVMLPTGRTTALAQHFPIIGAWRSTAPLSEICDRAVATTKKLHNPPRRTISPSIGVY
jgi:hypothetical protein